MTVVHDLRDVHFTGVDSVKRARRPSRAVAPPPRDGDDACRAERATRPELDPLLGFILERAGLDPAAYRARALQRRAVACLRQLRTADPARARAMIERDESLAGTALSTVLIGVSDFFRDREVFAAIERTVIPELLQRRRGLRVCSVGVSSGQELYSMAILLTEAGALTASDLIGIDCREDALQQARRGRYASLLGVSAERRDSFFEPSQGGWRVHGALRDRTTWRREDLFRFSIETPADVLLFRNVAIYLDERRAAAGWERLAAAVAPGGYLITGKAERPPAMLGFERVAPCIFRKP